MSDLIGTPRYRRSTVPANHRFEADWLTEHAKRSPYRSSNDYHHRTMRKSNPDDFSTIKQRPFMNDVG